MGYCQILQATCKAGAKGSYKLQSPSEALCLAFNECKLQLPKCLLDCVYRRKPWSWHWLVQAAQCKWGKHLINTSWALIFLKIVLCSDCMFSYWLWIALNTNTEGSSSYILFLPQVFRALPTRNVASFIPQTLLKGSYSFLFYQFKAAMIIIKNIYWAWTMY